jgi:16S rRNA (adenine1518-N6/adenine1519-N6)-dimethyltransferase
MLQHRPKKALGQNFLRDANVLSRIVSAVALTSSDRVLEVGPGKGALTAYLADRAAQVIAVEYDRQLAVFLSDRFRSWQHVDIVAGDILKIDLDRLLCPSGVGKWKVAANLPYNISSQVLFRILDNRHLFSLLVLMFQKEVGDRLLAPPDTREYGILTVLCRLHYDIERVMVVKPGAFHPVPKVDSVVLRFITLEAPREDVGNEILFRRIVKAAFNQRRKTLWNCLKSAALTGDEELRSALSSSHIDGARRGETLSLKEFALLTRTLLNNCSLEPHITGQHQDDMELIQ